MMVTKTLPKQKDRPTQPVFFDREENIMKFKYRPTETTRVTSPFGKRKNPTNPAAGVQQHNGIDISPLDKVKYFEEPVFACADGVVEIAAFNKVRGNQVMINHGSGIRTRSQHLANITVGAGAAVKAGQIIGHMGDTGDSSAQHLHFEVIVASLPQNPIPYIEGLPMPQQHSQNYTLVQARYKFEDATMEYIAAYKYAESLLKIMLMSPDQQIYALQTIKYLLEYEFGNEIFEKLSS